MDRTDCHKSFLGIFPRYLKLPMLEQRVLGVIGNVRGNPMNLNSTNLSGLQLFPSQVLKLLDPADCPKSFVDVFS